jgi:Protein of unknown function (DUF2510)
MAEIGGASRTAREKVPGWEPDHINPNLQRYWDGSAWTATRRWVAGQWIDDSAPTADASAVSSGTAPTNQNQYVRLPPPVSTSAVHTRHAAVVRPAIGGLLICSILLILGAFTPWLTISLQGHSTSVSGTDPGISQLIGVNGWITFSAGILLFVLACMIVVSGEALFRSVALLVALGAAGFAIYDLVRMLQKISQAASASSSPLNAVLQTKNYVGWGLIVTVVGGCGALLLALSRDNA